ncbi:MULTISPECIES: DHA2 family efflux MFS transporter permease subunit [Nostoc]|uniref:DHA2 family efflux MFS transporter permease subunit n=1 Tax=Nostoc paludosum FACHB-159 TaxID=2692908 RepID=A0ABR8KI76_9NOSO|nr:MULTISPECIES: DHA2 family efflux MFS transporter permease subunit [Nostoc]MBD2681318.1 DHA2 family efflux MFS transporter permease subunit [Nostoc sp. FACHB-857]MBD2737797.1 DHA2 family efflux MFS transporter permease subunit [Nostoc paludosum FACHB-159]
MTKAIALSKHTQQPTATSISLKTWIGVFGTILGAFMAVLDIQITNASLQDIQAALGASLDEGSWISSSYLVAEMIIIPLTSWLPQIFSTRRYLIVNVILFILFSICCAHAWDLPSMIAFRAGQGLTGGILIPMAFTVLLTSLPPALLPMGMALYSVTATFAPSIGPTLGGWLTDNFSWEYIFYLNIVPGIIVLAAVWYAIAPEPMRLNLLKHGDWWGIGTMAVGFGSLQIVLEEGSRKDWFDSNLIVCLTAIAILFIVLFFLIELLGKQPFINLRLFRRRNFTFASIVNVCLGLGMFGSLYILPLYLSEIQGYDALQIGEVMMWAGLPQLFLIPFVPKLMQIFDTRLMIAVGVSLFATSCFMNSHMTHDTGMAQLRVSQFVRAMGQPLIMIPLSTTATGGIPKQQAGSASSLYNMMRNLGGSIGTATLATLVTNREQFHSERLGEDVSLYSLETQQRLSQMTQYFTSMGSDLATAKQQALAAIDNIVRREAYVMAFNDCFYFLACALLLSGLAVLFLKKVKASGNVAVH